MASKRHRHEFHALWWCFGPYGRQDVHVHSCVKDETEDGPWKGDCDRVLVGPGRDCTAVPHHRETLSA